MTQPLRDLPPHTAPDTEAALVATASALYACTVPGLSDAEHTLLDQPKPAHFNVAPIRRLIEAGLDPLGEAFCRLRSPEKRRPFGATYTPPALVGTMVDWAARAGVPTRIVDPGLGSGRFLLAAGRAFPQAQLIGVEIDPLAALIARANLAAAGFAERSQVLLQDYRALALPAIQGQTLYIGNPPYVRHHLIPTEWKDWLASEAKRLNLTASQLAGLHVHFFLATAKIAQPGDLGAFITAAEWLDVNYGRLVRELLLSKLGGQSILVIEPTARPFPDAATTAAITTFTVGETPAAIHLRRVDDLNAIGALGGGIGIGRDRLAAEARWTTFSRAAREVPQDYVQLGELCRVHRGQVTGANNVWIAGDHSQSLPASVLFPTVTKARELFLAAGVLADAAGLRRVIDLPVDLDAFDQAERRAIDKFLRWAKKLGADKGYIARKRRAWWAVRLREPPPILATYMARRPPAFVQNLAAARYINIAHGLYPREPLTPVVIARLATYLADAAGAALGRTYAGGLMKFEPREMERMIVPAPAVLQAGGYHVFA